MEKSRTNRGFSIINFNDLYDVECSLQKSSLATEDAIWLGVDDADPKIIDGIGWVPYDIPDDVILNTRMHLNREQAKKLVDAINVFIETGDL